MSNRALTLSFFDCEKEFQKSVFGEKADGFILDDSIDYGEDYFRKLTPEKLKELYSLNSLYSYKFGLTLQEEDDVIANLYSCNCGQTTGLDNLDEICPVCGTVVERAKFKEVGWFYIKPRANIFQREVKMLHPYFCNLLCNQNSGLLVKRLNGENNRFKGGKEKSISKIEDFTWKDLFFDKNKLKEFVIKHMPVNAELILKYEDLLYTSVIPVISKNFRPLKVKNKLGVLNLNNKDLNIEYQVISECIKSINEHPDMIEEQLVNKLKSITLTMGNICNIINEEVGVGKKSMWRSEIVAPRIDNSGRLIIEPIVDTSIHDIDIVQLPLDFFRVVFSEEVEMYCKEMKVSPNKIRDLTDLNYVCTETERAFIREHIFPKIENIYIYMNREPCLYTTSVLGLRVHSLIDEMVMRIPLFILPALNGDFDGDALFSVNYGTPYKRLRIFQSLGIKKSVIDTVNIKFNDNVCAPNNNCGIVMWKGFKKDAVLQELA